MPTESLPQRSHEVAKKERRTLVRKSPAAEDIPSTSALSLPDIAEDVLEQGDNESIAPWESQIMENGDMKLKLRDGVHSLAKYTVIVNSTMEFSVFVFHWPLPEDHTIYTDRKRSIRGEGIKELLSLVENYLLCNGLPEDDLTKSVAVDPTSDTTNQLPGTVIRHSAPKHSTPTHFEVSVNYRSVDCRVVLEAGNSMDNI